VLQDKTKESGVTSLATVFRIRVGLFADPDQDPSVFLNADRDSHPNRGFAITLKIYWTLIRIHESKINVDPCGSAF
jgi:hypothetical protein